MIIWGVIDELSAGPVSMNIFISWSGDRSRAVAEALREWLPYVLPPAAPWMSTADIDRGSRWSVEISKQLDQATVGIICLTPENIDAPWVLFEAGALSKALTRTLVCTYLFQLRPSEVQGPLSQFQATHAEKAETQKLVASINRALESAALPDDRLNRMFEVWWPDLEQRLGAIAKVKAHPVQRRPDRDMLEEILLLSRKNDIRASLPDLVGVIREELKISGTIQEGKGSVRPSPRSPKPRDNTVLIVDTRPLLGASGGAVKLPYPLFGTVSDFLDELYGHVADAVPQSTFGRAWALRDITSGAEIKDMGRTWAKKHLGTSADNRRLEDVGIKPGMHFEAIPLRSSDG